VLRSALALLLVLAAAVLGGTIAMTSYGEDASLSLAEIRLSVDLGGPGALDLYVPLVDWGARFEAIRLPAQLNVDVRTIDRRAATRLAEGGQVNVRAARMEAEHAIARYLRRLVALLFVAALALGLLVALALRGLSPLRLRWLALTAVAAAVLCAGAAALLLPPRGQIAEPEYYAHGPEIPRALEAYEAATVSVGNLQGEIEDQLVGIARLVSLPAGRQSSAGHPRAVVASDLHNNVLAIPLLEDAAGDSPVFFVGDLTDRGSRIETRLVRRIAHVGSRFVFVSGNHDSDLLQTQLARAGAIVLTERGRLLPDGRLGDRVVTVAGLRVAGYGDPFVRRRADDFGDRLGEITREQQEAFAFWLDGLIGQVDVVMVHEPELAALAIERLEAKPPSEPIALLVGHTHRAQVRSFGSSVLLNGGTVGAGGTGNLAEHQPIGLALLVYDAEPRFEPLAADLVEIDPGNGSATAHRRVLGP
jgi:predicted phosphodiesterase